MTHTSITINVLRAALALAFIYFGARKLGSFPTDVAIYEAIGMGQFPRYVTGSVELTGAALLWVRGWQGIGAFLLLATMIIGLSALLIWVGPPYWHMLVLMAGCAIVVWAYRDQIAGKLQRH